MGEAILLFVVVVAAVVATAIFKTRAEIRREEAAEAAAARQARELEDARLEVERAERQVRDARAAHIRTKYAGNPDLARRLTEGAIWIGQTEDQLFDAIGRPDAAEETVTAVEIRRTFRYNPRGNSTLVLDICLRNGHVSSWTQK